MFYGLRTLWHSEWEMCPIGSCIWTLGPQLVTLFEEVWSFRRGSTAEGIMSLWEGFNSLQPHPSFSFLSPCLWLRCDQPPAPSACCHASPCCQFLTLSTTSQYKHFPLQVVFDHGIFITTTEKEAIRSYIWGFQILTWVLSTCVMKMDHVRLRLEELWSC